MRWLLSEYLLKGVFLGLLVYVALQQPKLVDSGQVGLWMLIGFGIAIVWGAFQRIRDFFRSGGRVPAFVLFVLLESPMAIYAGILGGLFIGAKSISPLPLDKPNLIPEGYREYALPLLALAGAFLGYLFALLRSVEKPWIRLILCFAVVAGAVSLVIVYLAYLPQNALPHDIRHSIGMQILIGLPFFYLLSFAAVSEESEVEIAALCGGITLSIWLIQFPERIPAIGLLIPLALYFVYATYILPGLRVFKHTLRGYSYSNVGRYAQALRCFRRALQLDPKNELALAGLWRLHRSLDMRRVSDDLETLSLLDFDMCLDRCAQLLISQTSPTTDELAEARQLLNLVESQRPEMAAKIDYFKVIADTHAKNLDSASEKLSHLLNPAAWKSNDIFRKQILLAAWQLALMSHPELNKRVGQPQLTLPGRRMEAIAAVERALAENPQEQGANALRRTLYSQVTEAEYLEAAGGDKSVPAVDFSHEYALELGKALIDDVVRWTRGAEYLRIAARGLSHTAPVIYGLLAEAHEKFGDSALARQYREQARAAGQHIGVANLATEPKEAYFAAVRRLAEDATARGDWDEAIHNWHLYTECERSGVETLRNLAELYERKGNILAALRSVEHSLIYGNTAKDVDLQERKAKYYNSVNASEVAQLPETVRDGLDYNYCITTGNLALAKGADDIETIDWARQLGEVACALKPNRLAGRVLLARAKLRLGQRDEALRMLEDVREAKPSGSDDQDAWYTCCQILAQLYLDELNRPDLAILCLKDFRESQKAGADTDFKLGRAYEAQGDIAKAIRSYELVAMFEKHPLYWDAKEAIRRLKQS